MVSAPGANYTYDTYGPLTMTANAEARGSRTYNAQGMRVTSSTSFFKPNGVIPKLAPKDAKPQANTEVQAAATSGTWVVNSKTPLSSIWIGIPVRSDSVFGRRQHLLFLLA